MNFGKSIRLYLQDGTVSGLKFGEVVNQTIQSVSCPRKRLGELAKVLEAQKPGVSFLNVPKANKSPWPISVKHVF